jgi:predicted Zn-dependent peptidase
MTQSGQVSNNILRAVSNHTEPRLTLLPVLLLALILFAFSKQASAGALYKWVDENGQIRYSDRLPPNQVKRKHQQLNSQGVILSTKEADKSDEELAAAAEAKRKLEEEQAAEAKIRDAQFKLDQVLLLTFSTEEELTLARDDRLVVLESVIQLINKSIDSTQQQLDQLQTSADEIYLSKGKEVPGGLAQKIEHFTRKVENRSGQLEAKMAEKSKINNQYRVDLARFRELKVEKN